MRIRHLLLICVILISVGLWPVQAQAAHPGLVLQVAAGNLMIWDKPSLKSKPLKLLNFGQRFSWEGVTSEAENRRWMHVSFGDIVGWASPQNGIVQEISDPYQPTLFINVQVPVNGNKATTPIYANPSLKDAPQSYLTNQLMYVVGDSVDAELYKWWEVDYRPPNGGSLRAGWVQDIRLKDTTATTLKILSPLYIGKDRLCTEAYSEKFRSTDQLHLLQFEPLIRNLIDNGQAVDCIAGLNLRGDGSSFEVVLSRDATEIAHTFPRLQIFEKQNDQWVKIYDQQIPAKERAVNWHTEEFRLLKIGDATAILWTQRGEPGSTAPLKVAILRYQAGAVQDILNLAYPAYSPFGLPKGSIQADDNYLMTIQSEDSASGCCTTKIRRILYEWDGSGKYVEVQNDVLPAPWQFQAK